MTIRKLTASAEVVRVLAILAITQTIGWGVVSLPPVIGSEMARSLGMSLPAALSGSSVMFVVAGLAAPHLGKAFVTHGARRVMSAGSIVGAAGLTLLALAGNAAGYFLAWAVLGLYGAAMLTTGAYIFLNELAGTRAKGAIGTLMVATGLAGSIFWPLTAFLSGAIGWRATVLFHALLMVVLVFPLLFFALPSTQPDAAAGKAKGGAESRAPIRTTFWLIIAAIAFNGLVSFGFEAIIIELLKAMELTARDAVAVGSIIGIFKICGRMMDMAGGRRWDGLATGLAATAMMPLGILALLLGGGSASGVVLFATLFGIGSGAFAVARATMPLVFYDGGAYAEVMSRMALPLNLIYAAAPPALAAVLTGNGAAAVLWIALSACLAAFGSLLLLNMRRIPFTS